MRSRENPCVQSSDSATQHGTQGSRALHWQLADECHGFTSCHLHGKKDLSVRLLVRMTSLVVQKLHAGHACMLTLAFSEALTEAESAEAQRLMAQVVVQPRAHTADDSFDPRDVTHLPAAAGACAGGLAISALTAGTSWKALSAPPGSRRTPSTNAARGARSIRALVFWAGVAGESISWPAARHGEQ
jgi:hypothetical protein